MGAEHKILIDGVPYDRWVRGEATDSDQEYLIHLGNPRFFCKLSPNEDAPIAGVAMDLGRDDIAHSFVFLDAVPSREELELLCQDAHDALDRDMYKEPTSIEEEDDEEW